MTEGAASMQNAMTTRHRPATLAAVRNRLFEPFIAPASSDFQDGTTARPALADNIRCSNHRPSVRCIGQFGCCIDPGLDQVLVDLTGSRKSIHILEPLDSLRSNAGIGPN